MSVKEEVLEDVLDRLAIELGEGALSYDWSILNLLTEEKENA